MSAKTDLRYLLIEKKSTKMFLTSQGLVYKVDEEQLETMKIDGIEFFRFYFKILPLSFSFF